MRQYYTRRLLLLLTIINVLAEPILSSQTATTPPTTTAATASSNTNDPSSLLPPTSVLPSTLIGESALIDRETGQVYWQGGSTISPQISSISSPLLTKNGLSRIKTTILSAILLLSFISMMTGIIRESLLNLLRHLESADDRTNSKVHILRLPIKILTMTLRLPRFERWFVILIYVLYLLESYTSGTRNYLANGKNLTEIKNYVKRLTETKPVVTWNVRCFHTERRRRWGGWKTKVVTHSASTDYEFDSWKDDTISGVWKRSIAASPTTMPTSSASTTTNNNIAPYAKIRLSKVLMLGDIATRRDYFRQQSQFVTREGQKDDHAEFSTTIRVDEFQKKILAVRNGGISSSPQKLLYMFWFFTIVGLTLPFRIWFDQHCDDLCVTVIKETFLPNKMKQKSDSLVSSAWMSYMPRIFSKAETNNNDGASSSSGSMSSPTTASATAAAAATKDDDGAFTQFLKRFDLYDAEKTIPVSSSSPTGNEKEDIDKSLNIIRESTITTTTATTPNEGMDAVNAEIVPVIVEENNNETQTNVTMTTTPTTTTTPKEEDNGRTVIIKEATDGSVVVVTADDNSITTEKVTGDGITLSTEERDNSSNNTTTAISSLKRNETNSSEGLLLSPLSSKDIATSSST